MRHSPDNSSPAASMAKRHPALPPHLQRTLKMLRGGKTQREIAAELGISSHTIHQYVRDIYQRFGVRSRVQLLSQMLHLARADGNDGIPVATPTRKYKADAPAGLPNHLPRMQ